MKGNNAIKPWTQLPRPVLLGAAILLAAAMLVHSGVWMYYIRWQPRIHVGLDLGRMPQAGALVVSRIEPHGPAEQAGLQVGDRILSINGRAANTLYQLSDILHHGRAEEPVRMTIARDGAAGQQVLALELRASPVTPDKLNWLDSFSSQLITSFPVWFLVVSLPVLFLRLRDRNAWLMALLFAGIIGGGPLLILEPLMEPRLDHFAAAYKILFTGTWAPLFNYLFSVFPVRSFIDRRFPWLKAALLSVSVIIVVPLAVWALLTPREQPLWHLAAALGSRLKVAVLVTSDFLLPMGLGTASLIGNGFFSESREVQRKIRVIVWGTLAGLLPGLLVYSVPSYLGRGTQDFPLWLWGLIALASFWLFPLSFAYAVLKHRVLEIPVLLKLSARYFLAQRGFGILLLVLWVVAVRLFTYAVSGLVGEFSNTVLVLGLVFGVGLVWVSTPVVKGITGRIDRAFFRSAYDARMILQELAEKTRTVTDRGELARLLKIQIEGALHPKSLAVYLEGPDGNLVADTALVLQKLDTGPTPVPRPMFPVRFGVGFFPRDLNTIPSTTGLVEDIAQRGKAWDVPQAHEAAGDLGPLAPECVVPILGRNSRLFGLLVLGPRHSEEPYSSEDKHLLDFVASQAGITLENIDLAEKMAERLEAERRAARDMEIAKEVQTRLFPQKLPQLVTLEYAGRCTQAREVGGDYYDFLNLGAGRMGIVLADISGKGIPGALLMANLQAGIRSQCAIASQNLGQFLKSVNQSFCESTDQGRFATLFFGDYQDATRRLQFANCGHNPPFLVRADGSAKRLEATATVLGLFEKWECCICEVQIEAGDVLVIYTDGITEASNSAKEEFGEARLLETVRASADLPVAQIVDAILAAALEFSAGEKSDDLTLVVARGR